jgi:hypothetical protein
LTHGHPSDTLPAMLWPYRPREDMPSTPRWLFVLVLVAAVIAMLLLFSVLPHPPVLGG